MAGNERLDGADDGFWHQDCYPSSAKLTKGLTLDYLGTIQIYMPDALVQILRATGPR